MLVLHSILFALEKDYFFHLSAVYMNLLIFWLIVSKVKSGAAMACFKIFLDEIICGAYLC